MRKIDLIGKTFGFIKVIKLSDRKDSTKHLLWECQCICGTKKTILGASLVKGSIKSCGCMKTKLRQQTSGKTSPAYKHGFAKKKQPNRFYHIFNNIIGRCNNPFNSGYKIYGGRGIKCLWKSFEEFRNDMYEGYQSHIKEFGGKNTTIDRIDNNGNYCKKNCRWTTWNEQAKNRNNNSIIEFEGEKFCITDFAQKFGIKETTLHRRLTIQGMTPKQAITIPVRKWVHI